MKVMTGATRKKIPRKSFINKDITRTGIFTHLRDLSDQEPSDKDPTVKDLLDKDHSDKDPSDKELLDKDLRFKDRVQGMCINKLHLDPDKEHKNNDQDPYVVIFVRKQTIC